MGTANHSKPFLRQSISVFEYSTVIVKVDWDDEVGMIASFD